MSKKSSEEKPVVKKAEAKSGEELSEKELEQVAGGTADYLLKIEGVPGETEGKKGTPSESIAFNFTKPSLKYNGQ